jgi:hypothetical protein
LTNTSNANYNDIVSHFLQITLKLEPLFKRSITYLTRDDSDLAEQVVDFGHKHEFADITWYPSQGRAVYRVDDRVAVDTPGNGLYDFIPFRPTPSLELAIIRTAGMHAFLNLINFLQNLCYSV